MINTVLTRFYMRGQNLAEILSRCAVTLLAHVAHSLSGCVACVDCGWIATRPIGFAPPLQVPRAWICAISLNYDDMSINFGRITPKNRHLDFYTLAVLPKSLLARMLAGRLFLISILYLCMRLHQETTPCRLAYSA